MLSYRRLLIALAIIPLLSACASMPRGATQPPVDKYENVNRKVHRLNNAVDRAVIRPATEVYRGILPEPARKVVHNFFSHWTYPTVIVNDVLQGKFKQAGRDTGRFALNTLMGVGGLFDVATPNGLPAHQEDFGQTLATWGVPPGPYIVLPLLGPSTLRGALSRPVDGAMNPLYRYIGDEDAYGLLLLTILDTRSGFFELEAQTQDVYDDYLFLRDAYIQRRNFLIFDGDPPIEDPFEDDEDYDYDIEI